MARCKKTITVRDIVMEANRVFQESADSYAVQRGGIQTFLGAILHATGNYRGFSYLPSAGLTGAGTGDVKVADDTRRSYTAPPL